MKFLAAALAVSLAAPPEAPTARPAEFRLTVTPPVQAALAGDLMFSSFPNITWKLDLSTMSATNLCVSNLRSTHAYDVNVEVWVSKQIPTIGGNLAHATVATFYMGTVPAMTTRCADTGAVPMTPPLPDVYWATAALYEGTGTNRTLQQLYTLADQVDFGGPYYEGSLYFDTPAAYYVTDGGARASLQVRRIVNSGYSASRQLRLRLWASPDIPRYGTTVSAYNLIEKAYSPLSGGYQYSNVDTGSLAVTPPPAGTYWITAALLELGTDGTTWYYTCFYTFPTRTTFTGAAPAPVADFSFSPDSPKVGETVTFYDLSSGSATSWFWNFGDGQTSTARNPTHVFSSAGVFNVTLTATNASGSTSKTRGVGVTAVAAPSIAFFSANPPAVSSGQRTILSWSSTGGTSASISQGVGSVPTTGSVTVTPLVGSPYTLTVTGPGGTATASLTVSAVPSTYAGTWILPSSARVAGVNAFWTTDLTVMNSGSQPATLALKLLGHDGNGAGGPERTYTIPARVTLTWPDVLATVFGRETDWGPILIRSSSTTLAAQGPTWTASPTGGSYGQSVPALGASEAVGATPRSLAGVRQDDRFRTNVVLANMKETEAVVTLQVLLPDGTTATSYTTTVGPLGFVQLNLANNLGVTNLVGGSVLVSSSTPGAQVAAYASVIDAATADPRTILAR
ncbi:MAG: PKD domain-containing protein [Thermoanaerobaculia bacterium]